MLHMIVQINSYTHARTRIHYELFPGQIELSPVAKANRIISMYLDKKTWTWLSALFICNVNEEYSYSDLIENRTKS